MIVQCENCETRFHVADARIPERGARVRCSRCHHRFHITPSSGTTSSPNSGPDVSARTEDSGREPEPEASEGAAPAAGAAGGDDLENPEFLFEGNSVSETAPRAREERSAEPEGASAPPEPEAPRPPSPDLEPAQAPEVRVVATTGKTAQEMLDAGAPKLAKSGPRIEFAESMEDTDSDDTRSRFMLADDSPAATPREPPPSLRPAKDKPAKPVATLTPIQKPPVPAPKPAAAKPNKSEIDAAFGGSLGDDEDTEGGWESLTQSDDSAPKSVFDVGASFGLANADGSEAAASDSKPVTRFDAEAGTKKRQAPAVSAFDPEAASSAGMIARALACVVGVALLAGAIHGLELQRGASAAGSEADQGAGWVAADVETFVARDSLGQRVLVVRGNLFPNAGAAAPPEVQVSLLGTGGEQVGEPRRAWLERLDDAEIAPEALTVKLASNTGELSGMGPQVTGFTALLADPPAAARRVQVNLAPGKASPTRGTATATMPPPVTPPAHDTELATPKAPPTVPPAPAVQPVTPPPHETQLAKPSAPPAQPVTPPAAHETQLAAPKPPAKPPVAPAQPARPAEPSRPEAVVPASPAPEPD
jgi:predicted Zn finger-like uncharacterized protein